MLSNMFLHSFDSASKTSIYSVKEHVKCLTEHDTKNNRQIPTNNYGVYLNTLIKHTLNTLKICQNIFTVHYVTGLMYWMDFSGETFAV